MSTDDTYVSAAAIDRMYELAGQYVARSAIPERDREDAVQQMVFGALEAEQANKQGHEALWRFAMKARMIDFIRSNKTYYERVVPVSEVFESAATETVPSPEERFIEKEQAAEQVKELFEREDLTNQNRDVLVALRDAMGDHDRARLVLGLTSAAYRKALSRLRKAVTQ